jgi:Holliday junction resolvase
MRAPSSGAATTRDLPDVLFSKVCQPLIAGELKTTGGNVAYYASDEVEALRQFATAFSAKPRLLARYKQDTTYYGWRIDDARVTDTGRYAVDREIEPRLTIEP